VPDERTKVHEDAFEVGTREDDTVVGQPAQATGHRVTL
jgi:hypothetical protein